MKKMLVCNTSCPAIFKKLFCESTYHFFENPRARGDCASAGIIGVPSARFIVVGQYFAEDFSSHTFLKKIGFKKSGPE